MRVSNWFVALVALFVACLILAYPVNAHDRYM